MKTTDVRPVITDRLSKKLLFCGNVGQDGAIYGDLLFRFEANGKCTVYSLSTQSVTANFKLDKLELFKPHCNTVCFGSERADESDEFPLLYCNIYNNYAKQTPVPDDRLEGYCCVYRLVRDGDSFSTTLVQIIRIGFVEDLTMWKSLPDNGDKRPYGNFVPDVTRGKLYVYVMRDANMTTRYFEFDIPRLSDGEVCPTCGARVVVLGADDIKAQFDCEYSKIIQGGCAYDGLLYSVMGGTVKDPATSTMPKLKVIDMIEKRQLTDIDLHSHGLSIEPEMIDFAGDTLYYMDASGAVYTLEFC